MAITNPERIAKGIELLRDGLRHRCEQIWADAYGENWLDGVNQQLNRPEHDPSMDDAAFLLKGMKATWNEVFGARQSFPPTVRSYVFELSDVRNKWAHQKSFSSDDTERALDTMERLLGAFGNIDERNQIKNIRFSLRQSVMEEASRSELRKKAAEPTEGTPMPGLISWREIITPHRDVQSGNFEQAEFAADLHEVAHGSAEAEYSDPREFFARTYLTSGLRNLLLNAANRLSGKGGDPVTELQTNFGGGKTHSMIALYHLASDIPASDLVGIGDELQKEGLSLPENISKAVIVGQMLAPASPETKEDGVKLHTIWGHLAYQLGGKAGYELVREDDEAGTSPGGKIKTLFQKFGPAIVLIDEWVAYARQLPEAGEGRRLAAGDFDTQFTFAQALTEAAAAVDNVAVLVTVPASDIEVGGDRGRTALERLKNVVARTAAEWQPATPDESFETARRRLFDEMPSEKARQRDAVIKAFSEVYKKESDEFPSEVGKADFRKRMEHSYPIHPELFDRLFGDWSSIDKFQRTRGVLRLMAVVISELWSRGDSSLLIMPGNLPMDSDRLVSEMKKYLEEGWDPVIKADIDGSNSLPLQLDKNTSHFGRLSAARRVARTVYLGSAPGTEGTRGIDLQRIKLGCVQPGEPVGQFADALRRLSNEARYLYVDGSRYWYSLDPNVTRLAADRAVSDFSDIDVDEEIKVRIKNQSKKGKIGNFAAIQTFANGPGDVPDDDEGVRLAVLKPDSTHSYNDEKSKAVELAEKILQQRESGPRLNRNLLVFLAAEANRIGDLRNATRSFLAWNSIVDDQKLGLSAHQQNHAEVRKRETSEQVDNQILETFNLVLSPSQNPSDSKLKWQSLRTAGIGELGERVSRKLESEEKLIPHYSGVRVKMDLDGKNLWSERGDLLIASLWEYYARHPHMPRLASRAVLNSAISDGTAKLNWQQESFAYAEGHDGTKWVGVRFGEHVEVSPSGLLVNPERLSREVEDDKPLGELDGEEGAFSSDIDSAGIAGGNETVENLSVADTASKHYYAQFSIDPIRGVNQISEILEHVAMHLGDDVSLTLEVQADNQQGFSEEKKRIVSENANSLGAQASEFE